MVRQAIVGFLGDLGTGKTLCMSYFAYKLACIPGRTSIYSNFSMFFNKYGCDVELKQMNKEFLQSFFDTKGEAYKSVNNTLLIIDEISAFIDSYEQMGKKNKVFSKFVLQSRKRNVKIFYTAQYKSLIPKRIRLATNMIIRPMYHLKKDILEYSIYKFDGENEYYQKTKIIKNASRYFDMYDTNEIIQVLDD